MMDEHLAELFLETAKECLPRYLAVKAFVDALRSADNDGQRERMINHVGKSVCLSCGNLHLPCYCTRDE